MSEGTGATVDNDSLVGLLNQLAEVPDPMPVSMVPQTAGWLVLLAAVMAVLAWRGWRLWQHYQANAYRRAALKALSASGDDPVVISGILKRAAMVAYGRRRVAGLSGQAWVAFLAETGAAQFDDTALFSAAYQKAPGQSDPQLATAAREWVKSHKDPEAVDV
ncbi:DUF4381 domain-containing protein [uncultured Shimia sp.]|uniref:DUF4381 domain-containing protein n=1 Tax=uncultured Shimia sp. TaxID=573152 RepID=UPI0025D68F0D|nr:DUF4381 domain-containing protein [uncultured Shimia sp.]